MDVVTDINCKSTRRIEKAGMKIQAYAATDNCDMENENEKDVALLIEEQSLKKFATMMTMIDDMMEPFAQAVFSNKTLFDQLKSRKYDLCLVDGIQFTKLIYLIPYKLDVPIASFLTVFNPKSAGVPGLPSFTPMMLDGKYTDEMNFFERLGNMLEMFVIEDLMLSLARTLSNDAVSKYAPERPYTPLNDIVGSSQLWLLQNDIAIDYPRVSLPHVVDVGGLNTGPAKPLAENFKKMADDAEHGVIVVSFGSSISALPKDISVRFLNEFRELKQTVIWRFGGELPKDVPPHVKLVKWLPQNDLLAHPNTKVFVTHCGGNGQFETLYNAVPMVGVPFFGDQIYNAKRMAKNGLGIHVLDGLRFKTGKIQSAIQEVLMNDSYRSTMALRSQIFKDRPMTPKQLTVYWIEHVIKYGSKHLVSRATAMPWYKYWCFDILSFCFAVIVLFMLLIYKLACCLVKLVGRTKQKTTISSGKPKRQ